MKSLDQPLTSTVTGKLQITIPARLARKCGIKAGVRLVWRESSNPGIITVQILPDPMAGLREAQSIAAKNKRAATKLMREFESDRAWQLANGPTI